MELELFRHVTVNRKARNSTTGSQSTSEVHNDQSRYMPYVHAVDEATMWGSAVGFGQGEWSQFLDGFKPQVQNVTGRRHSIHSVS